MADLREEPVFPSEVAAGDAEGVAESSLIPAAGANATFEAEVAGGASAGFRNGTAAHCATVRPALAALVPPDAPSARAADTPPADAPMDDPPAAEPSFADLLAHMLHSPVLASA